MKRLPLLLCCCTLLNAFADITSAEETEIDYAQQIQPIFQARCVSCHGAEKQESGYRLDIGALVIEGGDRGAAVVPGKAKDSLLYQVLTGEACDITEMPAEGDPLTEEQIDLIKNWIDQGAAVPEEEQSAQTPASNHWAFQAITHPTPPAVQQTDWIRNPIDSFILAKLESAGLTPSSAAEKATLIRRLSLDLRGVVPSLEEVESFLNNPDPAAYDQLVDQYLASPKYGERWGRHWLDLARYADSNGFTIDGPRSIWKYRDWVIQSLNHNKPFDQFVTEQLAGDLLPQPTQDQMIATGFHRNTLINEEGGTDPEQFRVEAVVDRVNTTGTVFLGLTVGCAQCHTHKYDPITQREYYQLFAIFNNCDEPTLPLPSLQQEQRLAELGREIQQLKGQLEAVATSPETWSVLVPQELKAAQGSTLTLREDGSILAGGPLPDNDDYQFTFTPEERTISSFRLTALTDPSLPKTGPGRAGHGNFVLNEVELSLLPVESPPDATPQRIEIAEAVSDHAQEGWPISATLDGDLKTGWAINVKSGSLNVKREAVFRLKSPLKLKAGDQLTLKLKQTHNVPQYLLGCFQIATTSLDWNNLPLHLNARVAQLEQSQQQLRREITTTMVLRERRTPRESYVMIRGDFLRKGPVVEPAVLQVLHKLPEDVTTPSRLDFSRWLFAEANPLTARVTVNRFWQRFFGSGLVETENDFGTQASLPTHPELLDFLATEFRLSGWDLKALHRLIVTSATYRQSSHFREDLAEVDPGNLLLGRQNRHRLEAETVRDVCLSASGLLSDKMYGPSVYPPQPEGIYVLTQNRKSWPVSQGAERYRRGIYTFFWRSSPYPFLSTFDAPMATTTCTRRPRSNTPLQALTLANDEAFLEFARGLGHRVWLAQSSTDEERIQYLFQLCLTRKPTAPEISALQGFLNDQRNQFQQHPDLAKAILAAKQDDPALSEQAAWTALARVVLNLDETITRE